MKRIFLVVPLSWSMHKKHVCLQTPQKINENNNDKKLSTIQLGNVNKHLQFMKMIKEEKHNQYICLPHI